MRVAVYHRGRLVGVVTVSDPGDTHTPDPVPEAVLSDIRVTYLRDNRLFGESGDGWSWRESGAAPPGPPRQPYPAPDTPAPRLTPAVLS